MDLFITSRAELFDSHKDNLNNLGLVTPQIVQFVNENTQKLSLDQLEAMVLGKRVLLLVHGFNSVWSEVCGSYKQIEANLQNAALAANTANLYDLVIGYMWPGEDHKIDYPLAVINSKRHISAMADILKQLSAKVQKLDVISHSLGCFLTLSAIGYYNNAKPIIGNLFLQAAAVDNEEIQFGEKFYAATQACSNVFVFHSKKDMAMWAYLVEGDAPLGLFGAEDIDIIRKHSQNVKFANGSMAKIDHGDYKKNPKVFDYMASVIVNPASKNQFETL